MVPVTAASTIMTLPSRIPEEIAVGLPGQYLSLVLPNGKLLSSMPGSNRVNELLSMTPSTMLHNNKTTKKLIFLPRTLLLPNPRSDLGEREWD